jgi:hypothetical protein
LSPALRQKPLRREVADAAMRAPPRPKRVTKGDIFAVERALRDVFSRHFKDISGFKGVTKGDIAVQNDDKKGDIAVT